MDFNLYLGLFDTWTATLVPTLSSGLPNGFDDQESLKVLTNDYEVCAVPAINDQQFLPFAFYGDINDGLIQDLSRATEGMLHVFDLGEVTGEDAQAAIEPLARIFHQIGRKMIFTVKKQGVIWALQKYTLYLNGFMKKMAVYLEGISL